MNNFWRDEISVRVLAPHLEELLQTIDRIPFRMDTWPAQASAIEKCSRLLNQLKDLKRQVDAEKLRKQQARDQQQMLFQFPRGKRKRV
jgi:hypothetical protein